MAIRVPSQQETLRPIAATPVVLPQGGQGARQIASGLEQARQSAARIEEALAARRLEIERKRNTQRVFEAEVQLRDLHRQFSMEMQASRRGSEASGLTQETDQWFENTVTSLAEGLENDTQVEAFRMAAEQVRSPGLDIMANYEARQLDVALSESMGERINSMIRDAAASLPNIDGETSEYTETEVFSRARAEIIATVQASVRTRGLPVEGENNYVYRSELIKALTALHGERIENMRYVNPTAARAYFEANKSEIDATVYDQINRDLDTADVTVQAQRAFDALREEFGTDFSAMDEAAKDRFSGDVRDDITRRIAVQKGLNDRAVQEEAQQVTTDAYSAFEAGQFRVDAIPLPLRDRLNELNPTALINMRQTERNWYSQAAQETKTATYARLRSQASGDRASQDAFLAVNIAAQHGAELSIGDRNRLEDMQDQIRAGRGSTVRTQSQTLDNATAGITDPLRRMEFERAVVAQVNAEQDETGAPVSPRRYEEIVQAQGFRFYVDNWFSDQPDALFAEILANPQDFPLDRIKVELVPGSFEYVKNRETGDDLTGEDIEAALEAAGIEPTLENILRAFQIEARTQRGR